MAFKELQAKVDHWIGQHKDGYWDPADQILCLTEEVGELAREINHLHGPKRKKATESHNDLGMEIADIVVILCCIANQHDIDLDAAWQQSWEKFETRDKDRFEKA